MNNDVLKPIIIFGYCLILMAFIAILMHLFSLKNDSHATNFTFFTVAVSLFHFIIGLGVILKKNGVIIVSEYIYICCLLDSLSVRLLG